MLHIDFNHLDIDHLDIDCVSKPNNRHTFQMSCYLIMFVFLCACSDTHMIESEDGKIDGKTSSQSQNNIPKKENIQK